MKNGMTIKVVGLMVILTILIIASGVFAQKLLYNDSVKLGQAIDGVMKDTKTQNWDQAESKLSQLSSSWEGVKHLWSALIDHQEIDNIDVTLSRLQKLVETRDISSSMSEAAALKKFIDHIPDKESISMDNVF